MGINWLRNQPLKFNCKISLKNEISNFFLVFFSKNLNMIFARKFRSKFDLTVVINDPTRSHNNATFLKVFGLNLNLWRSNEIKEMHFLHF